MKQAIINYYNKPTEKNKEDLTKSLGGYVHEQALIYSKASNLNLAFVDDVAQETMIKLLSYIDHFSLLNRAKFTSHHRGLIQRIVKSQVITYIRKYKDLATRNSFYLIDHAGDPWELQHAEISDLINQLDPADQFIFRMKLQGNSDKEIGNVLGYQRSSITKRLKKIRQKLGAHYYGNNVNHTD
jgi:RNA polymerase sigma factor (sigma-70 family)